MNRLRKMIDCPRQSDFYAALLYILMDKNVLWKCRQDFGIKKQLICDFDFMLIAVHRVLALMRSRYMK